MKTLIITAADSGQRLDKLLLKYLDQAGKGFIYKMIRKKNITLNGKRCDGSERLSEGDEIKLFLSDETIEKFSGSETPHVNTAKLDIAYEDENIIIVNKPAGMLSQRSSSSDVSLVEYITEHLLETGFLSEDSLKTFRPSVCNRLDRNTGGLIVAGKSLSALQIVTEAFRDRSMHKEYRCLVKGKLSGRKTVTGYLAKDEKTNKVFISESKGRGFDPIATGYEALSQVHILGTDCTLLNVTLITGRSHQIRAHLSSLGHPVIGDPKYGDINLNKKFFNEYGIRYQMLYSYLIRFPHLKEPLTYLSGKTFTAPVPDEFKKLDLNW